MPRNKKGTKKKYEASILTRNNVPGWHIVPDNMTDEDRELINNLMEQYVSYEERWNYNVWTFWKKKYVVEVTIERKGVATQFGRKVVTYYAKRAMWRREWQGTLPALLRRIKKSYEVNKAW